MELVDAQAARTPHQVAAVFEGQQLTYGDLNQRANQLAHRLRTLGVGPDILVGVCLERSLEMLVAILGVVKAGGAYLPVDPAFPRDRQAFMLDDAKVPVLLTSAKLAAGLPPHAAIQICLDTEWDSIQSYSKDNPEVLARPREPGVRDLHVGVDGPAERGGGGARERRGDSSRPCARRRAARRTM